MKLGDRTVNVNGKIPVKEHYGSGEIAYLFAVSNTSMRKWIDQGDIPSFRLPGSRSDGPGNRRVHHNALVKFCRDKPEYEWVLEKLEGDIDKFKRARPEESSKSGIERQPERPRLCKPRKYVKAADRPKAAPHDPGPAPEPPPAPKAARGWEWYR